MGETQPGRSADPLQDAAVEMERFVAADGWDQPPRLFALIDDQLPGALPVAGGALFSVEHPQPPDGGLENTLRGIAWPQDVRGCAVVHETLLPPPPGVEDTRPADTEATAYSAAPSDRRPARLAAAVLRDGSRAAVVRLRDTDPDTPVLIAPDIAPELTDALLASLH